MFNVLKNRWYTAKVQAEVGAQFEQEVDGVLNVSLRKQRFINAVVASVPVENLQTARKHEVKMFYIALISLAAYLAEVMKENIASDHEMEAAVCLCLINRIERVNLGCVSEHERSMVYSAMQTLEMFQTK
ncbi:hypothetical protein BCU30_021715 [Vibrio lentus]|uniref:hypothetical protein n=1 Tax=Vibrio TaxID=662 RepID=UPI000C863CD8|nr:MULTISPECIES: hypothetical protein [Vibrio]MBU2907857.1 hypothetical protein [Vibrio splendidus]MDO6530203.1 hypothetical protein [Vibrio splendidus]MDO6551258.1 hypothetical protein [Vibrio splendidus]PMJ11367.1 hypothetical protein BCU30_06795 [Vibrio lentus]